MWQIPVGDGTWMRRCGSCRQNRAACSARGDLLPRWTRTDLWRTLRSRRSPTYLCCNCIRKRRTGSMGFLRRPRSAHSLRNLRLEEAATRRRARNDSSSMETSDDEWCEMRCVGPLGLTFERFAGSERAPCSLRGSQVAGGQGCSKCDCGRYGRSRGPRVWALGQRVGHTMNALFGLLKPGEAVTGAVDASFPWPAAVWCALDMAPESIGRRSLQPSRC